MNEKYCYVTLVTKEKYIQGANLLQEYLKIFNSKYPLIVMICNNIDSSQILANTIEIPDIHFQINNTEYLKKFYCLNILNYEKIIFLDADLVPKENFDYIFEICSGNVQFGVRDIINNDLYPHGGIIYFEPNKILFEEIIQQDKKYLFTDDEDLLNRYFNNNHNRFNFIPCFHHMGGDLKYWESKYFNKEIIYNSKNFFQYLEEFNEQRE